MKHLLTFIIISFLLSGCVYAKYHAYAPTINAEAESIINRLKNDTLLVVIPTYQEKERLLTSFTRKRGRRNKKEQKQKLLNLYAEQRVELEAIVDAFSSKYTFSEVLFIPDSLVMDFEDGADKSFFVNAKYEIDPRITYSNRKPIKLIKQFDQEWQIKISNYIVPNPFPNYYLYGNGLYGFLGNEKYDQMYVRVAEVFQRRFELFHDDPSSRIAL